MKTLAGRSGSLALLIIVGLWGCGFNHGTVATSTGQSTTIDLSGTVGATFCGEYLRDGKRVAFSGVLPWSITESNLSRLEIRKTKIEDTLVLKARGDGGMVSTAATPGIGGLRLRMEGGWSVETLR